MRLAHTDELGVYFYDQDGFEDPRRRSRSLDSWVLYVWESPMNRDDDLRRRPAVVPSVGNNR